MDAATSALPRRRVLWTLFWEFFKIATFVVGGGYAITLAAESIFVRKLHWMDDGELVDMIAIIQTVPGLMAGNAAIYIGYRVAGKPGALAALVGVALPSFLIILLVGVAFSRLPMDHPYLQGAFIGVRSALGGLTLAALLRTWPKIMTQVFAYLIAAGCLVGVIFLHLNPAWLLLASMIAGVLYCQLPFRRLGAPAAEGEAKP